MKKFIRLSVDDQNLLSEEISGYAKFLDQFLFKLDLFKIKIARLNLKY